MTTIAPGLGTEIDLLASSDLLDFNFLELEVATSPSLFMWLNCGFRYSIINSMALYTSSSKRAP